MYKPAHTDENVNTLVRIRLHVLMYLKRWLWVKLSH